MVYKTVLLRERFGHMGSHSGYDIMFEEPEFKNCKSIFRMQGFKPVNVLKHRSALKRMGFSKWSYLSWQNVNIVQILRNRGLVYRVDALIRDIKKKFEVCSTIFYGNETFLQELEAIEYMLSDCSARYVVHVSYAENACGLLASKKLLGILPEVRLVTTIHQPMSWWKLFGNTQIFHAIDRLVVLSESERTQWELIYPGKVFYIPHGVCDDFFVPSPAKDSNFTCIFSGQWLRDVDVMADIVDRVLEEDPSIRFNMVYPHSARDNKAITQALYRLARHEQVTWYANLSDEELRSLYQRSHILVLPMIDCTANNAVLESISCGLPVVTSELSSLQSYIDPSFSTMVSKGSVEEYVCVIRGHKASGAGYEKAAKLARKAAEAKSWKTIVRSVVSMYEE